MMDNVELFWMGIKVAAVVLVLLSVVPLMVWVERRGSALMQNRLGPNRVGPFGILQPIADAVKFIFKEEVIPDHVEKFYFVLAPVVMLIPAIMTFAVIPFAGDLLLDGKTIHMQIADLNVGVLYIFAISSLGVYGVIIAGWSSNNKYSLLGGLRSTAQMVSYELSMGLSIMGVIMMTGTLDLKEIVETQGGFFLGFIPKWGVFTQPVGFIVFLTAIFAETNRLPFDLPEGESELVGGYHTEYGSMKFALFFMAEYINMFVSSALVSTLFFGGYQLLPGMGSLVNPLTGVITVHFAPAFAVSNPAELALLILQIVSLLMKICFFMWFYVWVRWTLPRFRYDQLMNLGWKVLLPVSILNLVVTALLIYVGMM